MLKKTMMVTLSFLIIGVALVSSYALVITKPIPEQIESPESTTAIRVMQVIPASLQMMVLSQGSVVPRTQSELIPEVSGRVQWMSPNLVTGGYFEKDEVLLELWNADRAAQLRLAQSQRAAAASRP